MRIFDVLSKAKNDKKLLEAELLLAYILGKGKEWVIAHSDDDVSVDDMKKFHDLWIRLAAGEPLAYIVGCKEFYGLNFLVDNRVLIPRPETEFLVEEVLRLSRLDRFASKKSVQVVDVGTGCGAVACSLAKSSDVLAVCAVDVSQDACDVALKNASNLGCKIDVICGDLLGPVKDRSFDIIVANLPYIGIEKFDFVADDVAKYEPDVALYGGSDGLRLYERMFAQILEYGMAPRYILGEFGFLQAEALRELVIRFFPNSNLEIKQDLSGLDRNFIITSL
ncbi:protein-(glutamine-N5) methyltransferase, release factor-specific [Candidatus Peregrinibacteria bacterium CG22_combo_CG10-13_8_21_14_all_44_10]|nr:MAG: protein-(glutamine-N5) methyltransferase, release factor-specific [Candidatus Peregrinibacteria bacterium CG2_30_44_17]PIP66360.1 MAG: protein-(glutamine-N5) methyltransferase, release factor-specific [Candidatus Peregrinibacteria bacterium CG22_combo_CG10-13_8_21_14_all_44_10]PIS04136.1 MAG: peptide chain release factor N(5)-glutamine methyltransferase [Candidatus Peregrinibacteria bacterium CG10_big_fil_rev_8_21_14_0_10_44_7]PIX79214.1 MAG: peptide chain release factor N(5)-glutamine m